MMDATPEAVPAATQYVEQPLTPQQIAWRVIRAVLPLVIIALLVYLVFNFPALTSRFSYVINHPKPGNPALLPATTKNPAQSQIPVGGTACGGNIPYDAAGNPKAICDNYIYIPKIHVAAPIVRPTSTSEQVIDDALLKGVVKYPGTAEPGERGNVFLTGHSSFYWWVPTDYRQVFTLVPELGTGDVVIVYRNGIRYTYRVFTAFEVAPTQTDVLKPTPEPTLTLSTCVPIGTSYRRRIVQAHQESPDPKAARPTSGGASAPVRLPGIR